ncbi:hypothetical protein [uncultured Brevundimonas sp.]|uniref:hypothetical protein n=1 Tax=uncultured Brevundimonas sp. TaxID=213418 RepID=UPI0030ECE92E|tara:strand:- start:12029 stop:12280 length:252 start_codon:yes stop_codon:yes gene_type:complete
MEYPSAPPARLKSSTDIHGADAYDVAAWREPRRDRPETHTFDRSPGDETLMQVLSTLPEWVVIGAGGVVAAILGALVGGALHI